MKRTYEPIIGLEVHVELNTQSKMFCASCADYFGQDPNSQVCPVCLGLPGALPFINEKAIEECIKIGLALGCEINKKSLFERKNYFYPDLPKGYQISQYRWPLCINGKLDLKDKDGNETSIKIRRVHQEEDTGKLTHSGGETAIDFNRSSVPLVEIVTEPDFKTVEQVKEFAKELQKLFRYLGVSSADMEKGDMRLEANISVRKVGEINIPDYRVELKNINSFKFMGDAIEYEIKRQAEVLEKGEKLSDQTRGWNEDRKQTFAQREKEEAHDYRYFPDPDLPELMVDELRIQSLKSNLPELPWEKAGRYVNEMGLNWSQATIQTESKESAEKFEILVELGKSKGVIAKDIANLIINKSEISKEKADAIIDRLVEKNVGIIEDETELTKLALEAIKENPKVVDDIKKGKEAAIQVLIGSVMRLSRGKANTKKVEGLLKKLIKS